VSNQNLLDYIERARGQRISDDAIRTILLNLGYNKAAIDEGLRGGMPLPSKPETPAPFMKKSEDNPDIYVYNTAVGAAVPEDEIKFIKRWSWGGFVLGWIYFLASRLVKRGAGHFLSLLLPPVYFALLIIAGANGRKRVWESGKWVNFESYRKRQKVLDKIGIILIALTISAVGVYCAMVGLGKIKGLLSLEEVQNKIVQFIQQTQGQVQQNNPLLSVDQQPVAVNLISSSTRPLEIVSMTFTPPELSYPFSGTKLDVLLKNNNTDVVKGYNFMFFIDDEITIGQYGQSVAAHINPGETYEMNSSITQNAIKNLSINCKSLGLPAGQYHFHLKVSLDVTDQLNSNTSNSLVTDKAVPFTLISACK